MRRALLLSLVLVVSPSIARADLPGYVDLPSGHGTAPPVKNRPAFIAAREKVPGFFVVAQGTSKPFQNVVFVVASAEQVKKGTPSEGQTGPCFSEARPPYEKREESTDTPRFPDWNEGLSDRATVYAKTANNAHSGVTAVHRERLVTDATGTRLEIDDVWVDPSTRGVRKIGSATLPLRLLGSSHGLSVYAARDERDEKTKLVHFVVVPPRGLPNGAESLSSVHGDGRTTSSNSCSHLRFAVSATDAAADSVVVKATLRLQDLQSEAAPAAHERKKKEDEDEEREERRARVREAAVQLGVSKTKRDKQPVISVTFGWSGRETTQVVRNDE
jgi:hypothetical protein